MRASSQAGVGPDRIRAMSGLPACMLACLHGLPSAMAWGLTNATAPLGSHGPLWELNYSG